jgi:ABC-type sugar transport system ATPase subunit
MILASLWKYLRGFHIVSEKKKRSVDRMIQDLSVKVPSSQVEVSSLSGGNQQKVVIGKGLLTSPKVLLMDEPTRGIDVGAKAEVFQIMGELAAQGIGILFVTSELKEILAISDRVIVMSKGKITGEFDRAEATEEALVAASAVGHGITAA